MARYERKDAFYRKAKSEGMRSRAAYKLEELQREHGILRARQRVVDLGCWPGSWLQVAARIVGSGGRVVGVDLAAIEPPLVLENAIALQSDLTDPGTCDRILAELGGRPADVLLSDAAPKLTGVRDADRAREAALLEAIEALIPKLLRPGGAMIVKLLEGPEAQVIERRLRARFASATSTRPDASRKGTSERYLVLKGLRAAS